MEKKPVTNIDLIPALSVGSHESLEKGACIMEAVAFVAGEPWSDHPECTSPVIGAFLRSWNDSLDDESRNILLRPLILRLVGTRGSNELEIRRATMATDWLIREHTPVWLRLAGLDAQAGLLEALPEITDFTKCPSLMPTLEAIRSDVSAARDAAGDAAWDAAWDAALDAAWDAARAAAGAAALDAAWDAAWDADAARAAAGDAAWDAARAAAGVAAWDAAWDALAPSVKILQQSALALIGRMIEATEP